MQNKEKCNVQHKMQNMQNICKLCKIQDKKCYMHNMHSLLCWCWTVTVTIPWQVQLGTVQGKLSQGILLTASCDMGLIPACRAVDFGPKQLGWLKNQLGNPSFFAVTVISVILVLCSR